MAFSVNHAADAMMYFAEAMKKGEYFVPLVAPRCFGKSQLRTGWSKIPRSPNESEKVMSDTKPMTATEIANQHYNEQRKAALNRIGTAWYPADDRELRRAFGVGKSISTLALEFRRTESGIRARLEKLGLLNPLAAAPTTATTDPAQAPTKRDVQDALIDYQKAFSYKEAVGLLRSFGVEHLSALHPGKYGAVITEARSKLAIKRWNYQNATKLMDPPLVIKYSNLDDPSSWDIWAAADHYKNLTMNDSTFNQEKTMSNKLFDKVYTVNGSDIKQFSVENLNAIINRENAAIKELESAELKTKAMKQIIADRRANLQELIDHLDNTSSGDSEG